MPGRKDGADKPGAKPDARWTYGAFYLDQPHPERGGYFYACRYDAGSRKVARRSLRTADIEEAKVRLVAIADTAPASPSATIEVDDGRGILGARDSAAVVLSRAEPQLGEKYDASRRRFHGYG